MLEKARPLQAFAEAYELYSEVLVQDPKEFSIEWRAPGHSKFKVVRPGRWQSVQKDGQTTGKFIAHGLPAGHQVELRVLNNGISSEFVTVETKAIPDPLTDVLRSDPFGNPVGGIKGLCKGWVLDEENVSLGSNITKGLRCLRCGCDAFRHTKRDDASSSASPAAAAPAASPAGPSVAAPPRAAAAPNAAAPKPAARAPEAPLPWAAGRPPAPRSGQIPAPVARSVFWNSAEFQSEVLAADPPEFKVEWARDLGDGRPGEAALGAWTSSLGPGAAGKPEGPKSYRQGFFMLDNLPAGQSILVRIRDGSKESPWASVKLHPATEVIEDGTIRVRNGAASCPQYVPSSQQTSGHTNGGSERERCLRCGRSRLTHQPKKPRAEDRPREDAGLDRAGGQEAGGGGGSAPSAAAAAAPRAPWRPRELQDARHQGASGEPMPLAPGLRTVVRGDLEFVTNFDGSNGELLPAEDAIIPGKDGKKRPKNDGLERLHVVLRPDPTDGTESTGRKRWFYFGFRPAPGKDPAALVGKRVRMVVNGMSDMTDLFSLDGHRPFFRNVPHQVAWERIREPSRFMCRYEGSGGRGSNVGDGGKFTISMGDSIPDNSSPEDDSIPISMLARLEGGVVEDGMIAVTGAKPGRKKMRRTYIAWDFIFDFPGGTTYFAFSEPFGYEDLQEHLDRFERFLAENPRGGVELPAYSPRAPPSPVGADAEVLVPVGPYAGSWVKCRIGGAGKTKGTYDIHVPPAPPLWETGQDFPDIPPNCLRNISVSMECWRPVCGDDVYFHRQELCKTHDGRRVDLLTVSKRDEEDEKIFVEANQDNATACFAEAGGDAPARDFGRDRPVAFISARVHPGESPSSFAFYGFFQFIVSDDPRAKLLRERFVFKLVPMLNPDGVGRGHTRANAKGLDLNRMYSDPNPDDHEGIYHVLELLVGCANEGRLLFYLDMHAHAHTRGCILYGNALKGAAQVWNVGFAHVCQMNTPHFDLEGSEFPPKTDREHGGESRFSGRACVAAACRLYHAYTLECHYSTGRLTRPVAEPPGLEGRPVHPGIGVKTFRQMKYAMGEWESIGEGIAVSLLDMHACNPHSRFLSSRGRSLQGVLNGLAKTVSSEAAFGTGERQQPAQGASSADAKAAQLWRVVHDQVIARDGPALTRRMLDIYPQDCLVAVASRVDGSPWVKLAVPNGNLGGKLSSQLHGASEAFMLTDGSQKGLGKLLEPTNLWVRLAPKGSQPKLLEDDSVEFSIGIPSLELVTGRWADPKAFFPVAAPGPAQGAR